MSACGRGGPPLSHGDSRTICLVRRAWRRGRGGGPVEIRYLERGRQGRGNEFPLPVSPTPNGDIPTVQCQGIGGKEPDTAFHRLYPGYGCSPDIASTAPAPGRGGGGAPKARVGWGCRQKSMGILLRRRGWDGGCRQKGMGILCCRRWRGGGCRQKGMGISCRRRGRGGGGRQKGMGISCRRRGWGGGAGRGVLQGEKSAGLRPPYGWI